MNMKVVLGIVAVIIIAGGVYIFAGKSSAPTGDSDQTTNTPSGNSLQALVAAGSPVACTFATSTTQGTMYIANGMVAGDFTIVDPTAGSIQAHMITRDQTSYMWTSMSNQGFKSTITATDTTAPQNQGVDYNAQMDYHCSAWTPDTAKFNLPANISFTAAASFTPPAQGAGATGAASGGAGMQGTAEQCAQCDGFPSAQKAQCLAALHC